MQVGSRKVEQVRSYAMNCYIGAVSGNYGRPIEIDPGYRTYSKSSQLDAVQPATRFLFIDVNPASICTSGFGVDMRRDNFTHYPSAEHNGLGVVAFADGHIESRKWRDPKTRKTLPRGVDHISHGEASPRNLDLPWIRERTTLKK
jgi:prepilin-type processing-associated H-X9-DG protein